MLAYGLEAVPMSATREAAMNASYRRLLRATLGAHDPDAEQLGGRILSLNFSGQPVIRETRATIRQRPCNLQSIEK